MVDLEDVYVNAAGFCWIRPFLKTTGHSYAMQQEYNSRYNHFSVGFDFPRLTECTVFLSNVRTCVTGRHVSSHFLELVSVILAKHRNSTKKFACVGQGCVTETLFLADNSCSSSKTNFGVIEGNYQNAASYRQQNYIFIIISEPASAVQL